MSAAPSSSAAGTCSGRLDTQESVLPLFSPPVQGPFPARRAAATQWLAVASAQVTGVTSRTYRLPMPRPWGPAVAEGPTVTSQYLIATTVDSSDGGTGQGFSWTVRTGAQAIQAMVDADCGPVAKG